MELLLELFFEFFFELIVEGSIELGTCRKVPIVLRILALVLLVLVFGGVGVGLAVIAISFWKEGKIVGSVLFACMDICWVIIIPWSVRKKFRERNL